jgi:hypothetical protein
LGLVLATMAFGSACMETPSNTPDPARWAPHRDTLLVEPFDVHAIADAVAAHRGIALRSPVRVAHDEQADLLGMTQPWASSRALGQEFGLAQVGGPLLAKLPALRAQGLSGVYDRRTKLVWIRGRDDRKAQVRAWTLVHEIEHALQDEASWLARRPQNEDEALALQALIEGDADITAAAFVASRKLAFDHWVAHLLAYSRDAEKSSNELGDLPDFVRRQWLFPYLDGTALVGAVYRAGGYALVNRMFEHPPVSTAQVLHPEKYLAGELPASVPVPAVPDGYTLIDTGRMGELRTRGLVAPCHGTPPSDPPLGWTGDAYTIVGGPGGRSVLWSTVWDDETSAHQFEAALRANDACIGARLGDGMAPAVTILGDGRRVTYLRGWSGDAGAVLARTLLAAPIETAARRPPLGDVRLPPIEDPQSFVAKGGLRGGRYVSDPLGLSLSVQGFDVVATTVDDELSLEEYSGISEVHITIRAFVTSWTPQLEDHAAWNFMGAVEEAKVPIVFLGETDVATRVGSSRALRWSRGQGTNAVMLLVPVCGRRITIEIGATGGGPGVWEDVQRIAKRLRFDDNSPACRFATADAPAVP